MSFPLGEWIDRHDGARYNMAQSGLRGTLPGLDAALARPEDPDPISLRSELARHVGVSRSRIFLTHGATEGNGLVLTFLARRPTGRATRTFTAPVPEYPPLIAAAGWAGLVPSSSRARADLAVSSQPHNPSGLLVPPGPEFRAAQHAARSVLIDETFREFTTAPSRSRGTDERLWTTSTFTKVYGADALRVGYIVAPDAEVTEFGDFHSMMTDEIAPSSVAAARAVLRDRPRLLADARQRLRTNLAALRRAMPEVPALAAPVYFDRLGAGNDGDDFAHAALRAGILVCPGSFFGDATGVRITLTRPSFPRDLREYLRARERWTARRPGLRGTRRRRR